LVWFAISRFFFCRDGPAGAGHFSGSRLHPSGTRLAGLDSLRGIAALIVVLTHCAGVYAEPAGWVTHLPLSVLLWSGHGFVLVFFGLSGVVLFLPFRNGAVQYTPYLIKRIARIYLPFGAAILLAASCCTLTDPSPVPGLSGWFNYDSWAEPVTTRTLVGHLIMSDRKDLQQLDNAMWSLTHEMRLSILYPLIAWSVLRNWRIATCVGLITSLAAAYIDNRHYLTIFGLHPAATLQYLFLFTAGAATCLTVDAIRQRIARLHKAWIALASCCSLVAITSPLNNSTVAIGCGSVAALVLVALAASGQLDVVLLHRIPTWLGRISYSLYLLHLIVLLSLVHLFAGKVPLLIILGATVGLSLALAEVMYRLIERPSINLGKTLAATFSAVSDAGRRSTSPG
jgi:peptidoglycan/LPS O-acetylase OafA/YrhL